MTIVKGLARDTLIATSVGTIPLPLVTTDHFVRTPSGYSKVTKIAELGSRRVIAFDTTNDLPIVAADETSIFTEEGKFTTMKSLRPKQRLFGVLSKAEQTGDSLNLPAHFKIDSEEKQLLLFSLLGCMMLHKSDEETLTLTSPYCVETFRHAVGELFRWPAAEKRNTSSVTFDYSEVPVLPSFAERYSLCTSLDNVVMNLVLPAPMACKAAFLKSFLANMKEGVRCIEVNVTNWILRRQLQVLLNEFGIHCLVAKDSLRIPNMFLFAVRDHIGFVDNIEKYIECPDVELEFDYRVRAIDNSGVADLCQLTTENGEPFLANTIFVKT